MIGATPLLILFVVVIFTNPCLYLLDDLRLNSCTSRVYDAVFSNKIARVISTWHVEDRLSWRRWLGTSRSQGRDNLTGSPRIVGAGHKDEASRILESKPATSVLISSIIRSGTIKTEGVAILRREPLSTLPYPVRILYRTRHDGFLSGRCSVLPPSIRNKVSSWIQTQERR